jgi:OOP family OmpA-OmpF porin
MGRGIMKAAALALTFIAVTAVFANAEVPAQPASPPNEPKSFRVYFQFGETELSPDAEAVVSAAADYAKSIHATYVEVIGHTDTKERNPLALSYVRAREVRSSLREHGLPDSIAVTVNGVGEADLAVPIPPWTAQPLDR